MSNISITISITILPNTVTVHPTSIIVPSVGKAMATVTSDPFQSYIYLTAESVTPGWIGAIDFNPIGGMTPLSSEISIIAAGNCPVGIFYFTVTARSSSDPYNVEQVYMAVVVTQEQIFKLTVEASDGGTVDSGTPPGAYQVEETATKILVAVPSGVNAFWRWTRDGLEVEGDPGTPRMLTITGFSANTTVKAWFLPQYQITVKANAGGTVSPDPSTTPFLIIAGETVHLIALADNNHFLNYWIIGGQKDGYLTDWYYEPGRDITIEAVFTSIPAGQHSLTIKVAGQGTTLPLPGSHNYLEVTNGQPTQVKITAKPMAGNVFVGWTIDNVESGSASPLYLAMDSNHTVTATFQASTEPPSNLPMIALVGGLAVATIILLSGEKK